MAGGENSRPMGTPRTHIAVGLLALTLYFPASWWGLPYATAPDRVQSWGVDDEMPLRPLSEVHGMFVPQPDRNLGYPLMHPLLVAAAYSPYLGYLWVSGQFAHPSGAYPYGLRDPVAILRNLTLIARLITLLMSAGIAVAAYDAGLALWDRRTGLLSAAFVATMFPMFYYSRTGNVEVPVLFFTAGALAAFARCLAFGFSVRRALWLGAFVGGALATKETAVASFLALPFVLLWFHRPGGPSAPRWFHREFWKAPLVAVASAIFVFGMGSSIFLDPQRYLDHVQFVRGRISALAGGEVAFVHTYPATWEGNFALVRAVGIRVVDCLTLPGVLLAAAGLVWVLWREPAKTLFFLPAVTYFGILIIGARGVQLRYVLPLAFSLAFFAARGVILALPLRRPWLAAGMALVAAGAMGLNFLRGADLTYAMLRDSRYDAAAWLAPRTASGARIEYFGPTQKLPPLERGAVAERAILYLGAIRKASTGPDAVAEIVAGWAARQPRFIISMPDHSSPVGFPDSATCPPAIVDGLREGKLGYQLAARFETPPLLPWVRRPALDYPSVNPPIQIFERVGDPATGTR